MGYHDDHVICACDLPRALARTCFNSMHVLMIEAGKYSTVWDGFPDISRSISCKLPYINKSVLVISQIRPAWRASEVPLM